MTKGYIVSQVESLADKTGSRDPFKICRSRDINIRYMDLQKKLKGFYFYQSRMHFIVVDENLNDSFRPIIVAHELGHAVLHKEIAMMKGFQEFDPLGSHACDPTEYEANLFAAELLLDDGETMDVLSEYPFFDAAHILRVPPALLDFKMDALRDKGYGLPRIDVSRADFLKGDIGAYDDDSGWL